MNDSILQHKINEVDSIRAGIHGCEVGQTSRGFVGRNEPLAQYTGEQFSISVTRSNGDTDTIFVSGGTVLFPDFSVAHVSAAWFYVERPYDKIVCMKVSRQVYESSGYSAEIEVLDTPSGGGLDVGVESEIGEDIVRRYLLGRVNSGSNDIVTQYCVGVIEDRELYAPGAICVLKSAPPFGVWERVDVIGGSLVVAVDDESETGQREGVPPDNIILEHKQSEWYGLYEQGSTPFYWPEPHVLNVSDVVDQIIDSRARYGVVLYRKK